MSRRFSYSIAVSVLCFLGALVTSQGWQNGLVQSLLGGGLFFVIFREKE